MEGDLKNLDYAISFDIDDSGLSKAAEAENKIDEGFKTAAMSATKIDSNISKAASSSQKAGKSAKEIDDGLKKAASGADKTNKSTKEMESNFSKAARDASGMGKAMSGATDKIKNDFSKLKNAIVGVGIAAAGGFGLFEVTQKAVDAGNSVYELSQKLHMNTTEAVNMSRVLTAAGVDTSTFSSTMTRLDRSLETASAKGNTTTKVLSAFKLSLTDAKGKLLPMNQQLDALAAGYQKAAEKGLEEEYAVDVLGNRGQELIPLLKDYAEAKEAAAKVKGIGIDPKQAHEAEVNLKALKMQTSQLGLAAANALMPITLAVMPSLMKAFGNLAQFISSHMGDIKALSNTIISVMKSTTSAVMPIVQGIFKEISSHKSTINKTFKDISKQIGDIISFISKYKSTILSIIAGIVGALGSFKVIMAVTGWVLKLKKAFSAGGVAIKLFTNPVLLAIVAISALIGVFIYAYSTSAKFRSSVSELVKIMKSMLPIIVGVSSTVGLFTVVTKSSAIALGILSTATTVWSTVTKVATLSTGALTGALKATWAVMAANPIVLVISIIAGLVAAFITLYKTNASFRDGVKAIWTEIANFFKTIAKDIIGVINFIISGLNKIKIPSWVPGIGGKGINIPSIEFKHAAGTNYAEEKASLVGENGPEIIIPPKGSQIKTANETSHILNSSQRSYNNVNRNASVKIDSKPQFIININESKNPKVTAAAVEKVLEKKFGKYFDKQMGTIAVQLGFTEI